MDFKTAVLWLAIIYLVLMNLVAFGMFFLDKRYAKIPDKRRVPEDVLFLLAACGGSVGAIASMWTFRHKTKHPQFVYGLPGILLGQIILLVLYFGLAMK